MKLRNEYELWQYPPSSTSEAPSISDTLTAESSSIKPSELTMEETAKALGVSLEEIESLGVGRITTASFEQWVTRGELFQSPCVTEFFFDHTYRPFTP